jgi:hypothetical protein
LSAFVIASEHPAHHWLISYVATAKPNFELLNTEAIKHVNPGIHPVFQQTLCPRLLNRLCNLCKMMQVSEN